MAEMEARARAFNIAQVCFCSKLLMCNIHKRLAVEFSAIRDAALAAATREREAKDQEIARLRLKNEQYQAQLEDRWVGVVGVTNDAVAKNAELEALVAATREVLHEVNRVFCDGHASSLDLTFMREMHDRPMMARLAAARREREELVTQREFWKGAHERAKESLAAAEAALRELLAAWDACPENDEDGLATHQWDIRFDAALKKARAALSPAPAAPEDK